MKKIAFLLMAAAVALVSCQKGGKTSPDVRTYGMTGDVREVYLYTMDPELEDDESAGEMLEFSFDEKGRVTEDDYGNIFIYDTDGSLLQATAAHSELTRDAQGRIVKYVNSIFDDEGEFYDEDLDVFDSCEIEYTYDAKGRVVTEEYYGWEWGSTYTYEYDGDAFYPSRLTYSGYNEGWNEEGTVTYRYLAFDDKGNWTEREVNQVMNSYEEPWEENQEPEIETEEQTIRQRRVFTYWSDKEN